jgi:hypothetical protein
MKTALILCALANSAFAAAPVLPRITPEELTKLQHGTPMIRLEKPAPSQAAVSRPAGQSIIKQSVVLNDGKNWTLIPKGAVIFLPQAMKNRVNANPVGTLLPWNDFLIQNRAWITTNDVSFDQAAGTEALPPERVAYWAKQEKIVIATHRQGPISIRIAPETQTITMR